MHRQHLTVRAPSEEMLDVVSRLCGVHAQLQSSAELTLWARLDGLHLCLLRSSPSPVPYPAGTSGDAAAPILLVVERESLRGRYLMFGQIRPRVPLGNT